MKKKFIQHAPIKSESYDSRLFSHPQKCPEVSQEVNVEVNVGKDNDCLTSCFSALGACFGKAAKSAAS